MKIDRLIGILSILLQQDKVTAPFLADKFEVSRRTINRDIESLCKAGIPISTTQGANGGISIMDGYKIDRTLLTNAELQAILAGLRSLDSISGTNQYIQLMDKLSVGSSDFMTGDQHILIDLASWYKSTLAPKIEQIHKAIEQKETLIFCYYSPSGESQRELEPYHLVFQWGNWYLWGWCLKRKSFRLFKLNRMAQLQCTGRTFEKRPVPLPDLSTETLFPQTYQVKALFQPSCKWRLIEEYGFDSFQKQPDGRLLFTFGFSDKENILSWILTFGDKVELLEPKEFRKNLLELGKRLQERYKNKI